MGVRVLQKVANSPLNSFGVVSFRNSSDGGEVQAVVLTDTDGNELASFPITIAPADLALLATAANQTNGDQRTGILDSNGDPITLAQVLTSAPSGTEAGVVTRPIIASLPLPTGAATETTLALIKAKTDNLDVASSTLAKEATKNLDGTATHGSRDLTSANTWYAVPSTVPAAAYVLVAQPRTGNAGTVRWSFLNSGTPGAGTGLEIQGSLTLRLAANESVVFASTTAGDDIDWVCKEVV